MVRTNLERLVAAHDDADLAGAVAALQHAQVAGAALLPLARRALKAEELCAHLEKDVLVLLERPRLHLLQLDDRLKVHLGRRLDLATLTLLLVLLAAPRRRCRAPKQRARGRARLGLLAGRGLGEDKVKGHAVLSAICAAPCIPAAAPGPPAY